MPRTHLHHSRRAGSHHAHFSSGTSAKKPRAHRDVFHDAMLHTYEFTDAPLEREEHTAAQQDIESLQASSEAWIIDYARQLNSGFGLDPMLVFGRNEPADPIAPGTAAAILAAHGK